MSEPFGLTWINDLCQFTCSNNAALFVTPVNFSSNVQASVQVCRGMRGGVHITDVVQDAAVFNVTLFPPSAVFVCVISLASVASPGMLDDHKYELSKLIESPRSC